MAKYQNISVSSAGRITTISLARPKVKNAVNSATYLELAEALRAADADANVVFVVLTGRGDSFCSGADLREWANVSPATHDVEEALAPVRAFMYAMLRCSKVLVAAVNGPAIGIGVTLLAHCDLVYASPLATFWVPFLRAAIVPEFASSLTFARIMGPALASDLLLMSRQLSVTEAKEAHLVADVLPDAKSFLSDVHGKLLSVLQQPLAEKSLPLFKKMLKKWTQEEVESAVEYELGELGIRYAKGETGTAVRMVMAKTFKQGKQEGKATRSKL